MKKVPLYLSFLVLAACATDGKKSSELDPAEIYKNFTVRYSEDEEELEATAQFLSGASWDRNRFEKTGGEPVELIEPARILFIDKPMEKAGNLLTGRLYIYKQERKLPLATWKYTDPRGKVYGYVIPLHPISFKRKLSRINYKRDLKVYWEGKPVQENEWVEVSLKGEIPVDSNKTQEVNLLAVAGEPGDEYVLVKSGDLERLKNGKVKLTITRKSHTALPDVGSEEGFMNVEYTGKSFEASIPEEGVEEGIFGF